MALYHLSVKTISRSAGRSATAAAAYRSGAEIVDERTGQIHDYTRKSGVESSDLLLPDHAPEWANDRNALWNAAEQSETRINSTVAREFEIALPSELNAEARRNLALTFGREIVERHGCAVDVSIHAPGQEGDNRNHHAHILCSTRRLEAEGFTEKTRELDEKNSGEIGRWRERFADLQNERLQTNGIEERVDHRSLKDQGIDREPTKHLGHEATAMERRGVHTEIGDYNRRIEAAYEQGLAERAELSKTHTQIIDTTSSLEKAIMERDQLSTSNEKPTEAWFEKAQRIVEHQAEVEKSKAPTAFEAWFEKMESERKQNSLEDEKTHEKDDNSKDKGNDYDMDY